MAARRLLVEDNPSSQDHGARAEFRSPQRRRLPFASQVGKEVRPGRTRLGELFVAAIAIEPDGRRADEYARRSGQFLSASIKLWVAATRLSRSKRLRAAVQRPSAMDAPARCTTASAPFAPWSRVSASGSQLTACAPLDRTRSPAAGTQSLVALLAYAVDSAEPTSR